VRVEDRLDNGFLHDINGLRYTRQSEIRPGANFPG
jgi:hypothetical protein